MEQLNLDFHEPPDSKICIKCGRQKSFSEFHKDSRRPDGFFPYCKRCRTKDKQLYDDRMEYKNKPFKRCSDCRQWQHYDSFYPNPTSKDGLHGQCKNCTKSRAKQWRIDNPEEAKEKDYVRYWQNKESENKRFQTYYVANIEIMHQRAIDYTKTEAGRASRRRYQQDEKYKAAVKRYLQSEKGKAKCRYHNRLRRARKLGASGILTPEDERRLYELYDHCLRCGETEDLTIDHVVPLSKGGADSFENCQVLCRSCNASKSAKTIDYR